MIFGFGSLERTAAPIKHMAQNMNIIPRKREAFFGSKIIFIGVSAMNKSQSLQPSNQGKKTGLVSQGVTEEPGEFSKQYNSRIT